jgi:hypothetical protein
MRKAALIFLFVTIVFVATAQKKPAPKQSVHTVTQALPKATEMLKFFYTAYMEAFIGEGDTRITSDRQRLLRRTYCTKRCLTRYDELLTQTGLDPLVKAIDSNIDAIKSLQIIKDKDPKHPDNYTVSYAVGDIKADIKLSLVTEGGKLKIDYLE